MKSWMRRNGLDWVDLTLGFLIVVGVVACFVPWEKFG